MANEYDNVYASLVTFVTDYIESKAPTQISFVDFDEYDDLDVVPEDTAAGIRGWSLTLDGTTFEVTTMFSVAVKNDPSGFLRRELISGLLTQLLPGKQILYRDAKSGFAVGFLAIVEGTTVTPALKTKTRALQEIAVTLKGDRKLSF